jgi:pimeloyl-ACP methyl ester carboxylesterase
LKPVLLLIPGLLNSPRVFDGVRALLDPQIDVRVADVQSQSSLHTMAHDAWASLADMPAAQPLVVAGYSMGGYVALQMLSTPRRRVQGLALVCTSARADTPEGGALRERAIAAMERDFGRYVSALLGFLVTPQRQADAALMATIRDDMLAVGAATAIRQHRAVALREDRRSLLPQLDLPAQVIAAGADPVTPPALSEELAAALAHAQLNVVDAVGHLLPFERPAEVAAGLSDLIARVTHQGSSR